MGDQLRHRWIDESIRELLEGTSQCARECSWARSGVQDQAEQPDDGEPAQGRRSADASVPTTSQHAPARRVVDDLGRGPALSGYGREATARPISGSEPFRPAPPIRPTPPRPPIAETDRFARGFDDLEPERPAKPRTNGAPGSSRARGKTRAAAHATVGRIIGQIMFRQIGIVPAPPPGRILARGLDRSTARLSRASPGRPRWGGSTRSRATHKGSPHPVSRLTPAFPLLPGPDRPWPGLRRPPDTHGPSASTNGEAASRDAPVGGHHGPSPEPWSRHRASQANAHDQRGRRHHAGEDPAIQHTRPHERVKHHQRHREKREPRRAPPGHGQRKPPAQSTPTARR